MSDFAGLADAGRRLGPVLREAMAGTPDAVLLAVVPNGVPVALAIRESYDVAVRALPVERSEKGAVIRADPTLAGRTVVVVDDGVETGTVARAAADALIESGAGPIVLAVPVCPMEAIAGLQPGYDRIVALVRPVARRSLAGHFDDFDTIDEAAALRLLAEARAPGIS